MTPGVRHVFFPLSSLSFFTIIWEKHIIKANHNYLRKAHGFFFFLFIRVAQGLTACHISFYLDVFLKRRCVYIQKRFLLPIISTSKTIVSVLDTLERQESALWIGSWELFAEQWQWKWQKDSTKKQSQIVLKWVKEKVCIFCMFYWKESSNIVTRKLIHQPFLLFLLL